MSYKAMCQPQIIIVVQGAGNVDTGLSAQVLYFGRSRFPPRVFDMTGSAHQIEFFVGNKIDKISKVVGHGMKSWNCSYIPGIFLAEAMCLALFEMVIRDVTSSGNRANASTAFSRAGRSHFLWLTRTCFLVANGTVISREGSEFQWPGETTL